MLARWDDDLSTIMKSSTADVYEKIMQRKKELNQTQHYLLLVILLFRLEWIFQLNKLKTSSMNEFNNIYNEFSILSSIKSAVQGLVWHLFSMGVSASSIIKKSSSSSIIQVTNPMVIETWILLLNFIQREKLESLLWSTLHIYAEVTFPLESDKNNPSRQDILSICEKADFTWFWLLTILILIRVEK